MKGKCPQKKTKGSRVSRLIPALGGQRKEESLERKEKEQPDK